MNDDFDFSRDFTFDDEIDGSSDELDELDDFDDAGGDIEFRTAVLQKNDMVALLCIKSASAGAAICRVDPREAQPAVQLYDDRNKALEWFTRSLRTSRRNGWNIIYDGLPLQG